MKKLPALILGIFLGILSIIGAIAVGLALIHLFDAIYRIDVRLLKIPEITGLSTEVILRNYHAVMDYLSPFKNIPFVLPDLAFSESGAQHFADVKVVFNGFYVAGLISIVIYFVALFLIRKNSRAVLRVSGITTLALPVALLGFMAIDFSSAFILFHNVFFSNELWWFDPAVDPVIEILPAEFFMHCGIVIALVIILAAIVQILCSKNKPTRLSPPKRK